MEIVQMPLAHQPVKIGHARLVPGQQDDVVGMRAGVGLEGVVDVAQPGDAQAFQRL